jgi:DNA-binding MarR family transcriptional regulator
VLDRCFAASPRALRQGDKTPWHVNAVFPALSRPRSAGRTTGSIGIDDASRPRDRDDVDTEDFARAFEHAFQRVYLQFHRRDGKRAQMSTASSSVLTHLAHTGPLTVGEMTQHLDRAQSVVSEIVTGLERKGLLARQVDPSDRRRTLVWLTPAGFAALDLDRQVLSVDLLTQAAAALPPEQRADLLAALHGLLAAPVAPPVHPSSTQPENGAPR